MNNEHRPPKLQRAVVYPIANGNYTDSGAELILSLRSIEKNLEEDVPVFVISEREPMYLSEGVMFIESESYIDAMRKACTVADEILWMNDDITLLRPHSWDELRKWARSENEVSHERISTMVGGTGWSRRKGMVLQRLKELGHTTYDYSTHTPYLFETALLFEVMDGFNFGYKTPIETAYANVANVDKRDKCRKLSRHHDALLPLDVSDYDILNYSDDGHHDHLRGFLLGMFPAPSRYEDHGRCDLTKLTFNQIK